MANIEIFKKFGVSSVASNVTYSASLNVFTGNGYTSAAGNNYFNAFRFAESYRERYVNPQLGKTLKRTIPDKPQSSKQKYVDINVDISSLK